MKKEVTMPLNTRFIRERIKELKLTQASLASKIGVDRITVFRWTSGKVKRISIYNAKQLAECLNCKLDDIIIKGDLTEYEANSAEDSPIDSITHDSIVSVLRPSGKYDLAESILKASIHPGFSMEQLAETYKCLCSTNFYKQNYTEALTYAYKCLSISKRVDNKRLFFLSLLHIANINVNLSKYDVSLRILNHCMKLIDVITISKEISTFYNNLAVLCSILCKFKESESFYKAAIDCLGNSENYMKTSIPTRNLCGLYIEIGDYANASNTFSKAYNYSINSNSNEGIIKCIMYKTDILILNNQIDQAKKMLKYNAASLTENNIKSLYVYEILARFYRFCGYYDKALEVIDTGMTFCSSDACDEGRMLQERARLALAKGDLSNEAQYRNKANEIFAKHKLYNRICNVTILEYGQMFNTCT